MPNYAKILKDILTKKRRFGEFETITLTKEFSAILTDKLPQKIWDPESFTIPISIGGKNVSHDLCDLRVGINLMPLSVDKFIFPADFIVIDYEADNEIPIILGRPFLATSRALIDRHNGELTM
ncbi:uncharacterized protein LOC111025396 [Momordica charantia]|uniref:Uncharacterized protein LOC111025396 n=1 Tax=Momordica charantia TaxID=3673 RepID=A0A6J1DX85_MOMCH|nr:uncharacterized protein LOC111025396 [Momordica charantia]